MNNLNQFYEPIEVGGKPLCGDHKAYRMDSGNDARKEPDMRKYLDLGACNTCDYFFVSSESVILIEEKRLSETVKKIREDFSYLEEKDLDDFTIKKIKQGIILKVYGSLLMLFLLIKKCEEFANIVNGKNHKFWFVISNVDEGDIQFIDSFKDNLSSDFYSQLGKKFMDEVIVITTEKLKEKLGNVVQT